MIAFRLSLGAAYAKTPTILLYRFNFTDETYSALSGNMVVEFEPYGAPSFHFLVAGYTPPQANTLTINFIA